MRLSALLLVACLVRPAAGQDPSALESLFPLAVGNAWTYKVSGQDDRFVVRVVDQELVGTQTCFKLEAWLKDKVVATEHVAFTKAGLCRFRAEHEDIDPPVCILKVPAPKGAGWEAKYTLGSRGAVGRFLATNPPGEVTVPAGKFRAVKVDAWTGENRGPAPPRSTVWYAAGVGPVRQWISEGKSRLELELEKFEKASGK
jgi:hypothetical protein